MQIDANDLVRVNKFKDLDTDMNMSVKSLQLTNQSQQEKAKQLNKQNKADGNGELGNFMQFAHMMQPQPGAQQPSMMQMFAQYQQF